MMEKLMAKYDNIFLVNKIHNNNNKMRNYHPSWQPLFDQYDFSIVDTLYDNADKPVYPPKHQIFSAFMVDVKSIKVLILGQDPYHGANQAHGLSFSVSRDTPIPPSLRNIYKELQAEFPERNYKFTHGCLQRWADEEGIFLLNASLTVLNGSPSSHMDIWSDFTDDVIRFVNNHNPSCIYLLLGNFAKAKRILISNKNQIVEGVHPSPMAARNGFFGSNIFKRVESALGANINWST
jgi:uracil-DNA glycosylase